MKTVVLVEETEPRWKGSFGSSLVGVVTTPKAPVTAPKVVLAEPATVTILKPAAPALMGI